MSKNQNTGKRFEVPAYKAPEPDTYSMYGRKVVKNGDNYELQVSGQDVQEMDMVKKLRSELLATLNQNSGNPNYDAYTNAYMKKVLSQAQPRLENSLIGRGMGGSTIYAKALADLITNAATEATLGGQQYKNNNLAALENYLNNERNFGQSLFGLQQQGYANKIGIQDRIYQQQLAQAAADYDYSQNPKRWQLGLSKMMSIADPGGSYMGNYQNPEQTKGASAQSMQGLGKAMELYSAYKGMAGGMGGGMGGSGGGKSMTMGDASYANSPSPFGTGANRNYGLLDSNGNANSALLHRYYNGY